MNIFILDYDPFVCARFMCDRHIVKMIVESAQMLSTTHHIYNSKKEFLYKPTHEKHPCTIWTKENRSNYKWHHELFSCMAEEYWLRYGRRHKTYILLGEILFTPPDNMPDGDRTEFALAMPEQYKTKDAVKSYREFYLREKLKFCTWTSPSQVPFWITDKLKEQHEHSQSKQ